MINEVTTGGDLPPPTLFDYFKDEKGQKKRVDDEDQKNQVNTKTRANKIKEKGEKEKIPTCNPCLRDNERAKVKKTR
jgi:hypothetical protein